MRLCEKRLIAITIAENATRVCMEDGTWANYSDYKSCLPLPNEPPETGVGISEDTTTIYFTGYTISIVALALAIWIFTRFKLVHSSLFFSTGIVYQVYLYLSVYSCWIVLPVSILNRSSEHSPFFLLPSRVLVDRRLHKVSVI